MEWCVVKTGIRQFDMLHAYGLAILLATVCNTTIQIDEITHLYMLSCPFCVIPQGDSDTILEQVLPLPNEDELRLYNPRTTEPKLSIAVLDGLLAALFTTPGLRALSVSDLIGKLSLDEMALQKALEKVAKRIFKWKAFAKRTSKEANLNWLNDILSEYHPTHPASPILVEGYEKSINVLMTIDPSLSYSLRSPYSDGRMMERTQVTVQGTRYAGLLAYLGASRFLRGHRLSNNLVNYYLPIAKNYALNAQTAFPLLFSRDQKPKQAAVHQWLAFSLQAFQGKAIWDCLAYQTLLTQGIQQSLSLEHGELECQWLCVLQKRLGEEILRSWQIQLSAKEVQEEQEDLLDCLKRRNPRSWLSYLSTKARAMLVQPDSVKRRYSLEEVRIITEAMKNSEQEPLKLILEREEGTPRFGRALRQIGRSNPSRLRDLIEELEAVQTRSQLLSILHHILLASELEKTKEQRIIVPTEKDMAVLLEDIDRFGIPEIVGLLLVLSVLHYPRRDENGGLKVDVSTMIRALSLLARYLEATSLAKDDSVSPSSIEVFLDDPELTRTTPEDE